MVLSASGFQMGVMTLHVESPALLLLGDEVRGRSPGSELSRELEGRFAVLPLSGGEAVQGARGIDDEVRRIDSLLQASGAAQVVPVAASSAGWVAIELLRRLGSQRVPKLVLLDWSLLQVQPRIPGDEGFGYPLRALALLGEHVPVLHLMTRPEDPVLFAAEEAFAAQHSWFRVRWMAGVPTHGHSRETELLAETISRFVAQGPSRFASGKGSAIDRAM